MKKIFNYWIGKGTRMMSLQAKYKHEEKAEKTLKD